MPVAGYRCLVSGHPGQGVSRHPGHRRRACGPEGLAGRTLGDVEGPAGHHWCQAVPADRCHNLIHARSCGIRCRPGRGSHRRRSRRESHGGVHWRRADGDGVGSSCREGLRIPSGLLKARPGCCSSLSPAASSTASERSTMRAAPRNGSGSATSTKFVSSYQCRSRGGQAGYRVHAGVDLHPESAARQPFYLTFAGRGHGGR